MPNGDANAAPNQIIDKLLRSNPYFCGSRLRCVQGGGFFAPHQSSIWIVGFGVHQLYYFTSATGTSQADSYVIVYVGRKWHLHLRYLVVLAKYRLSQP